MIQLKKSHQKIVKDILAKYPYNFYVFGSRVTHQAKPLSDLDLCFFDKIPWNVQAHIDEDFEESDLPYKVDLIDANRCSPSFYAQIKNDLLPI